MLQISQYDIMAADSDIASTPRQWFKDGRCLYETLSHGGRLFVFAGRIHQVENLQDGVKMAWDYHGSIIEPKKSHAILTQSCKASTWCSQPARTYNH